MSDRPLHLTLCGIAVSGQYSLDFPNRDLNCRYAALRTRQQYYPAYLSEGNTRFRKLLDGKDVFDDHQVGFLGIKDRTKLRKDLLQPVRQGLGL